MARVRRTDAEVQGTREATRIAATLGDELRRTRRRRRMTQRSLGTRVGLGQGRISDLERGEGATAPLDTWIALGLALDRPVAVSFSREIDPENTRDAGHLLAQELVLKLARQSGRRAEFEWPTRPSEQSRVIDIVVRDDSARAIVVIEIWNRLDDLGAAVRSTSRKQLEAEGLAVIAGGDGSAYRVASCWLFVDTASNRRLVSRYPEILKTRFGGSSVGWTRCLMEGASPPSEPGLAWVDTRAGRIIPLRHRVASQGPRNRPGARDADGGSSTG
jgi:transcriptional regulator with XRE-family HTH domain